MVFFGNLRNIRLYKKFLDFYRLGRNICLIILKFFQKDTEFKVDRDLGSAEIP